MPFPPTGYAPYGAYPPPPGYGPPGYGPPPGYPYSGYPYAAPPAFTAGDAWNWAWGQFRARIGLLIGGPLAWLAILTVAMAPFIIGTVVFGPESTRDADGHVSQQPVSPTFVVSMILLYAVIFAIAFVMSNCLMATQLDVGDAKPVTLGTFFKPRRLGAFLGVSMLIFLMTAVGTLACIVPGIILGFLAQYAPYFVVDRQMDPVAAIKASFTLVRENVGTTILVYLIGMAAVFVTEFGTVLTCGFGGLALIPAMVSIMGLMHVVTYRQLSGGQVAPVPNPVPAQ